MKQVRNILFDLDGTLTDPFQGITNCICYALEKLNRPCPPKEQLAVYIGPPLRQTFVAILESSDKVLIESAVQLYRERFSKIGLYENTVYANVTKMLDELRALSCNLFVATSKAEIYAEKILRHFSLDSYFTKIHGSDLEGRFDDKSELLRELIKKHNLNSEETIMIGDRKHDAIAAKKNGILSLGVTYGYGSREELEEAKVDCICENPLEIATFIRESWKYQITAI